MHLLPDRFSSKVEFSEGCWIWKAYKNKWGYGVFTANRKSVLAHRYSWSIHNKEIPDGLCILHHCDTPACVNPSHLFLGTHKDNSLDRDSKGRGYERSGSKNGRAKLTTEQINEIRRSYKKGVAGEFSQSGLARKYGVNQTHISRIVNGMSWSKEGGEAS